MSVHLSRRAANWPLHDGKTDNGTADNQDRHSMSWLTRQSITTPAAYYDTQKARYSVSVPRDFGNIGGAKAIDAPYRTSLSPRDRHRALLVVMIAATSN